MSKNYYDILQVPKSANAQDIKKAFRTLAKKYHPDRNKSANATQLFIQVEEAYTCLSNPTTRARYDRMLRSGHSATTANKRAQKRPKTKNSTSAADKEYMRRKAQEARAKAHRHAQMKYRRYQLDQPAAIPQSLIILGGLAGIILVVYIFSSISSFLGILAGVAAVLAFAFFSSSGKRDANDVYGSSGREYREGDEDDGDWIW